MLHFVKYTLSAVIVVAEIVTMTTSIIEALEFKYYETEGNEYFTTIVASNCSIFNSQQMICAAFLGPFCLSFEALTAVAIFSLLETLIILNVFLTTAFRFSQIDLATVKRAYYLVFWKSLVLFTLISIEFTYIFGIIAAYSLITYITIVGIGKSSKQLFFALKAKANDPANSRQDRAYLNKQVRVYKWGTLLIYFPGSALIIGISLFNIFPKGILEFFSRPCWVAELYSINLSENFANTIEPVKGWICDLLRFYQRSALGLWVFLCIGLNLAIQLGYLERCIKRKRRLEKAYTLSTMLKSPVAVKEQMLGQWQTYH